MALIDDAKSYSRTDEDMTSFVTAAEAYLTNAGITKDEENGLYCLAVKMISTHWYDNRGVSGDSRKLTFGIDCIISQLKNTPEAVI